MQMSQNSLLTYRNLWLTHFKVEQQGELIRGKLQNRPTFNIYDAFVALDTNEDGHIDAEEWEKARMEAKQAALEEQLSKPLPQRMHMLRKPQTKKYQPFLLSSKSEIHMSRKNRIISAGLSALFIIFIASIFMKLTGVL